MSALPKPEFKIGDRVIVVREGADQDMRGRIVMVWFKAGTGRYLVEFNDIDQQKYREQDLAADPKAAVQTEQPKVR